MKVETKKTYSMVFIIINLSQVMYTEKLISIIYKMCIQTKIKTNAFTFEFSIELKSKLKVRRKKYLFQIILINS